MKRSEALQKLVKRLESVIGVDPSTGDILHPSNEYLAYAVLDEMENIGLLPPFSSAIYYKTWRKDGTGHEWEVE